MVFVRAVDAVSLGVAETWLNLQLRDSLRSVDYLGESKREKQQEEEPFNHRYFYK